MHFYAHKVSQIAKNSQLGHPHVIIIRWLNRIAITNRTHLPHFPSESCRMGKLVWLDHFFCLKYVHALQCGCWGSRGRLHSYIFYFKSLNIRAKFVRYCLSLKKWTSVETRKENYCSKLLQQNKWKRTWDDQKVANCEWRAWFFNKNVLLCAMLRNLFYYDFCGSNLKYEIWFVL